MTSVTDAFTAAVQYDYDLAGNRTGLTYPDSKHVTYVYDGDNRTVQVLDWNSGTTSYGYDPAGRLITTTLPNGVQSVNIYDDANRLVELTHTAADSSLIASFSYGLDGVGNRITATETIRQPGQLGGVEAFLEENGLLVLEAESGSITAGASDNWMSQTVQSEYAGESYLRALPVVGQLYEAGEISASPAVTYAIHITSRNGPV